jgi:Ser/Thr protein kinase RdoA (MazF antagonist)
MHVTTVTTVLARYPSGAQPMSAVESLGNAGGLSGARLWRYQSGHGLLVLRACPPHGPGREHIARVHEWLRKGSALEFLPLPLAGSAGCTIQEAAGCLWQLEPWMPGEPDRSAPSAAHVRAAFAGMAALHQCLADARVEEFSPGLVERYQNVSELIQGGFDRLAAAVGAIGGGDEHRLAAHRWIELGRQVAPLLIGSLASAAGRRISLQPCLRDARAEHFLFTGGRLSGLVDFSAMGVDSVAGDLARLMGEWLGGDPSLHAQALAAYGSVRSLTPEELGLIDVFQSATALLIGERWLRWHYLEGRRFENPWALSEGLARGLTQLERIQADP